MALIAVAGMRSKGGVSVQSDAMDFRGSVQGTNLDTNLQLVVELGLVGVWGVPLDF